MTSRDRMLAAMNNEPPDRVPVAPDISNKIPCHLTGKPMEVPPMGDCDLAEIKSRFGDRLGLMGNLHTTAVMLRGTVRDVRRTGGNWSA